MDNTVLALDIGGTKTAWSVVSATGELLKSGRFPTPTEPELFVSTLSKLLSQHPSSSVGIGIAGTTKNRQELGILTNLPQLSGLKLAARLRDNGAPLIIIDNDARCALVGEVWKGSLQEERSAVFLTIGTGVGGATLQRGAVLPYPTDVTLEICRTIIDPDDHFPAPTGSGTLEALLGGKSLERRFGVSMAELSKDGHAGKKEALEIWTIISGYFHESLKAIQDTWQTKQIVVGGKGASDLSLYLGEYTPPFPVVAAQLGEQAGVIGAARLALDIFEDTQKTWDE